MTTEVAILNRQAVAIASDSASTAIDEYGRPIYSTAHKIFPLSKTEPVAIMIYGSAAFMGIPWETIIKIYRDRLGDSAYSTLMEYGQSFVEFMKKEKSFSPREIQNRYVEDNLIAYMDALRSYVHQTIDYHFQYHEELGTQQLKELVADMIDRELERWKSGTSSISEIEVFARRFRTEYSNLIQEVIREVFEDLPLNDQAQVSLERLSAALFTFFPKSNEILPFSGIVITGFGESDIFPSLISYKVQGTALDELKYQVEAHRAIGHDNSAMIIPFAQGEVMRTFIDGISPMMESFYEDFIEEIFRKYPGFILDELVEEMDPAERSEYEDRIREIGVENFQNSFNQIRQFQYEINIKPILTIVSILAKGELAEMADSLVNLTCLRKKFSNEDETVGGPVDVAVISKSDGLVWIRRKSYFNSPG